MLQLSEDKVVPNLPRNLFCHHFATVCSKNPSKRLKRCKMKKLIPRTPSRSSLRRIEPIRKILGYFRVPRTAGTSNTFEVLANFARSGICAANKTKNISSFNCQNYPSQTTGPEQISLNWSYVPWYVASSTKSTTSDIFCYKSIYHCWKQRLTDEPSTIRTTKTMKSTIAINF